MKRNLSLVGRGDEGKSLLTASGKIVHKIQAVQDYSTILVVTFCGRSEYPRQTNRYDGQYGTWYSMAHGWHTPVTCQGCIDGEKAVQAEALGHSVSVTRRNLGTRWGSTRPSYGRNVKCSCTWKIFTNESQEGSAKLDRWAEQKRLEHLLEVWEKAYGEGLDDVTETLGEEEQPIEHDEDTPRFSDGSPAPIDLIQPEEPYDERAARRKADEEFYRHQQERDGCDHLLVVPGELLRVASGHQVKVRTENGTELWLRLPNAEELKKTILESGAELVADGLPADCLPPLPSDEEIERIVRPLNL